MHQELFTHKWIIWPGSNIVEEDFEKFILDEAFRETVRAALTRITRGVTQTLSKGHTEEGKALYLWTMNLDLMNDRACDSIFKRVMATMKAQLEPHGAKLSMPLTEVVFEEDDE